MVLSSRGKARCVIVTQPGATPAEQTAAQELATWLHASTGGEFKVVAASEAPERAIIVGPGPAAAAAFPQHDLSALGGEETLQSVSGNRMLLAGGRPRGTMYAVYRFLQTRCGARWWAPWASSVKQRATLAVPDGVTPGKPAFEARDPFWFPAFDEMWAARNGSNSQHARLTEKTGGKVLYKGFVHTFFPLVPPSEHLAAHPEWYSLIGGKRVAAHAQLCTTNPELRNYLTEQVRRWLRETPEARIISISQNDWYGACQCPDCKAIDDAEGSHSGTMVALLNYVAQKLGPEFPEVAFDTLAYQYTRKAPKAIQPLPNVIIRLCSIECNFAAPLDHKSNAAFARDIVEWNKVCGRLYVWDYVTNFGHYVMPHPNWYSLGPNVRFFHRNGVRGMFEQGAYQSYSSEMAEMRAWVLAQLLWNPYQDDRKLIREFLDGYYGKAAPHVQRYLDLMADATKGFYMGCFVGTGVPYLKYKVLLNAEKLWEKAEQAVADDPALVWRVRQARLPVWYAWLVNWKPLRFDCLKSGGEWPVPASRKALADRWMAAATGPGPDGWSPMTHLNEGGLTPQVFMERFKVDPEEIKPQDLPARGARPAPPADLTVTAGKCIDLQDNKARLWNEPEGAETRGDAAASDKLAAWMPGTHHEWAFQMLLNRLPASALATKWNVYAVVRVEPREGGPAATEAFAAGVYDTATAAAPAQISVPLSACGPGYKSHLVGTITPAQSMYVWVAPSDRGAVSSVWVDRIYLTPAE